MICVDVHKLVHPTRRHMGAQKHLGAPPSPPGGCWRRGHDPHVSLAPPPLARTAHPLAGPRLPWRSADVGTASCMPSSACTSRERTHRLRQAAQQLHIDVKTLSYTMKADGLDG